jgi:hypothetical protein
MRGFYRTNYNTTRVLWNYKAVSSATPTQAAAN